MTPCSCRTRILLQITNIALRQNNKIVAQNMQSYSPRLAQRKRREKFCSLTWKEREITRESTELHKKCSSFVIIARVSKETLLHGIYYHSTDSMLHHILSLHYWMRCEDYITGNATRTSILTLYVDLDSQTAKCEVREILTTLQAVIRKVHSLPHRYSWARTPQWSDRLVFNSWQRHGLLLFTLYLEWIWGTLGFLFQSFP